MFALTGLVDLTMQILKTNILVNPYNVHTPTCLLSSIQFLIDKRLIWDLMDLGTKIKQASIMETAVMTLNY